MTNKGNTISVVVPVYNVAKFLARCIESILVQTVQPLEIILVDDGSLDNSGALCDDYAYRYEQVKVIHKNNGGLSSARKAGLNHVRGDLIVFIDSDDYIHPHYLEKLSASMMNPEVQLAICSHVVVNKKQIQPQILPYKKDIIVSEDVSQDYILPMVGRSSKSEEKNLPGFVPIRMYRTALIQESDFVSEREYFTEDVLMNVLYGKRISGKIAVVNEPLYYYCVNPGSLTLKYREKAYEMRMACNKFLRQLIEELPVSTEEKERRLEANLVSAVTFCVYNIGRKATYKEFKNEFRNLLSKEEVLNLLDGGNWPTLATWHKIILTCYKLGAWRLLYNLLKTRTH